MPFSTELVITPVEGVVRLEVGDPVDHIEHSEAQGEESSGDLVNLGRGVDNDTTAGRVLLPQFPEVLVREEAKAKLAKEGGTWFRLNPTIPCRAGSYLGPQPPRQGR